MKKIILAAAALLMTTGAFAQMNFDWGVKGGLTLGNFTKIDDTKMKPSIYLGAFAEFPINEYLSIQPEVIYSRQGFNYKVDGDRVNARFNYLNVPILAKIYVLENLSLDLGPQFGILLNAKQKYDGGTEDIDDAKNFDISVPIGLSYKINGMFDVSARYILGLTEVVKWGDNEKAKNSVIQIGVGYRF